MKRRRIERTFQSEIRNSIPIGAFYWKPADIPRLEQNPRPCDAILFYAGLHAALEYKAHPAHTAWSINSVKPHQIEGLEAAERNGAVGVVLLNVRYGKGKNRINRAIFIRPHKYRALEQIGRKSVSVADLLVDYPHIIPKRVDGKVKWPIVPMLEQMRQC